MTLLNRIRALYLRYTSHHAERFRGVGLPRHGLRRVGRIERVVQTGDGLLVSGWTLAPRIRFEWGGGTRDVVPDMPRPDVAARRGRGACTGFQTLLPLVARPLTVEVDLPPRRMKRTKLPHPSDPPGVVPRARMLRAFLLDALRAIPAMLRHAIHPGPGSRTLVKRALGLDGPPPVPLIDRAWLSVGGAPAPDPGPYTIVMPVHDAFDVLCESLDRVARHSRGDWHIVLVDDASTDPRVRPWLSAWARGRPGQVSLVELDENVGFVAAVNRGLEIAEERNGPVVLLNSDAMVPDGWAERLLAPLRDPGVASVTPMSNDAEIFGAPLPGTAVALPAGAADRVDDLARSLHRPEVLHSAPTGVGFCMALSRDWLARVPRLDTAFGRGYGEEVDWCQKVRRMGGRHVGQPALFVEHRGGQSFGAEKTARVRSANALISRRYPRYDAEVQAFFRSDPLRTPRLALAVAAAGFAARDTVPLYMAHALGGGAEAALRAEIEADLERSGAALVLRVGGPARFRLELHLPDGEIAGDTDDFGAIQAILAPVPRLRIVYSCGVGDRDPVTLPDLLLSLRRVGHDDRLEARLHDYFPLSPSYCLLGSDGRYRGAVAADDTDPAHSARRPGGDRVSLRQWRGAWGKFLSGCDEIRAFSRSSAALLLLAYPDVAPLVVVRPHEPGRMPRPLASTPSKEGTLAVLGNLNAQKGAVVVSRLAERLRRAGDPRRIVVIGNVDPACPMPAGVHLHGGYRREDIADLAARYGVAAWIVPSIWPETFSFTTQEALATGLPVYAFDIGGQGEAVAAAPNGFAVPFDPEADLASRLEAALPPARSLAIPWRAKCAIEGLTP